MGDGLSSQALHYVSCISVLGSCLCCSSSLVQKHFSLEVIIENEEENDMDTRIV